jgi:hypothetical protein
VRKPRAKSEAKVRAPLPTKAPVVLSAAKLKAAAAKAEKANKVRADAKLDKNFEATLAKDVAKADMATAREALACAAIDLDRKAETYGHYIGLTYGADCHTFDLKMLADIAGFFGEKETFFAVYKANYKGRSIRPNPTMPWKRAVEAVADAYNLATGAVEPSTGEKGRGGKKGAVDALKRDIPKLYLRLNKDKDFANNAKLQAAAFKLGEVVTMISGAGALAALNEKI